MNENQPEPVPPPIQDSGSPAPPPPPRAPDRTWEILCHLSALSGFVIPFGNIIAPLTIWLLKKDQNPGVDHHGKESLNFQISMFIYTIVAGLSILVVIGFVLLPLVLIANLVLTIVASIKASNGEYYRYPFTLRLIS